MNIPKKGDEGFGLYQHIKSLNHEYNDTKTEQTLRAQILSLKKRMAEAVVMCEDLIPTNREDVPRGVDSADIRKIKTLSEGRL